MRASRFIFPVIMLALITSCGLKKDLQVPGQKNAPAGNPQQSTVDPATNIAPSTVTNTQPPTASANPASQ